MIERERRAGATKDPWRAASAARIGESVAIATEEVVDGSARGSPTVLAGGQLERHAEADEVDDVWAARRVVEVGEAVTEARDGVLLDVSVAVQVDLRQAPPHFVEQPAHDLGEGPVDEAEVVVRRLAQPGGQSRTGFERGRLASDSQGRYHRGRRRHSGSRRPRSRGPCRRGHDPEQDADRMTTRGPHMVPPGQRPSHA